MSNNPQPNALELVKAAWERKKPDSPIYAYLLSGISFVAASQGKITAELLIKDVHINAAGVLHGSVSATIVDWAGGMAIASSTGGIKTGVSTDIHITYVSSAKIGEMLTIEGKVTKLGRNLAYTAIEIRRQDGTVVATGLHTKFLPQN